LVITLILWISLPFAIVGIKKRLEGLIAEAKKSNALHQQLIEEFKMSQIADRRKNEEKEDYQSCLMYGPTREPRDGN
jgi:hypothetical protein